MRINKRLNLVIPLGRSDSAGDLGVVVHTTPISSEVFDEYFLPLSMTYAAIYSQGLGPIAAPRITDKLLKKISIDKGIWDSDSQRGIVGVKQGLVGEIHRLTNVLAPGEHGWKEYMYQEAKDLGILDADEVAEVDSAIVFFTVCSSMMRKNQVEKELGGAMKIWGARLEFYTFTELRDSLPTSTGTANSGATQTP